MFLGYGLLLVPGVTTTGDTVLRGAGNIYVTLNPTATRSGQ